MFEACKPVPIAEPHTEFKVDDVREQSFRQGYATGFNEGMKAACELKQQNEQLKRRIVILEQQANKTVYDTDGCYE
jgi:flagellar biosynthesis/type III secretory pathway protein FliH